MFFRINQYGKDDATEIWDVTNDDNSNKYVVPYQLISHLLQRRRRHNVLRDTEVNIVLRQHVQYSRR